MLFPLSGCSLALAHPPLGQGLHISAVFGQISLCAFSQNHAAFTHSIVTLLISHLLL